MQTQDTRSPWKQAFQAGLLGGVIGVLLSLVGMVVAFSGRWIINGVFTMAHVIFLAPILLMAYSVIRRTTPQSNRNVILMGLLTGLAGGVVLAALLVLGRLVDLQAMFINASAALYKVLTFGKDFGLGVVLLVLVSTIAGGLAGAIFLIPQRVRTAVIQGLLWVTLVGLLRDLIITVTTRWGPLAGLFKALFAASGLTIVGAVIVFALIAGIHYWRAGQPAGQTSIFDFNTMSKQRPIIRWLTIGAIILILLLLPPILGIFFSNILDKVMMYILMGQGLETAKALGDFICNENAHRLFSFKSHSSRVPRPLGHPILDGRRLSAPSTRAAQDAAVLPATSLRDASASLPSARHRRPDTGIRRTHAGAPVSQSEPGHPQTRPECCPYPR